MVEEATDKMGRDCTVMFQLLDSSMLYSMQEPKRVASTPPGAWWKGPSLSKLDGHLTLSPKSLQLSTFSGIGEAERRFWCPQSLGTSIDYKYRASANVSNIDKANYVSGL